MKIEVDPMDPVLPPPPRSGGGRVGGTCVPLFKVHVQDDMEGSQRLRIYFFGLGSVGWLQGRVAQ